MPPDLETPPPTTTDYTTWTHSDLITRVSELERQLRQQATTTSKQTRRSPSRTPGTRSPRPSRRATPFNPSTYSTRHIALKLAYLGGRYNGFEHANGNITARPTVEEVLWCALRKARLISPPPLPASTSGSGGAPAEESTEVLWGPTARMKRGAFMVNWEGCQYSKCGRTDKGVSAFGQVVGVRVRSVRRRGAGKDRGKGRGRRSEEEEGKTSVATSTTNGGRDGNVADADGESDVVAASSELELGLELPGIDAVDDEELGIETKQNDDDDDASFDTVKDELPYISILNSILPPDIRVLAWCPNPPENFDARFSCAERRYKYFFTNPAFLPTPGPSGLRDATTGKETEFREGWLDIGVMREAAKKLVGLHDFRNFCRIDASKQLTEFKRRVTHVEIEEVRQQSGPVAFFEQYHLGRDLEGSHNLVQQSMQMPSGPKVYSFTVHGNAFLWHQVRSMVAVLFLIGQRLESLSLVDELLDIERNPCRPTYDMASDGPLVLWDCTFPKDRNSGNEDEIDWVYAGDTRSLAGLTTKGDGKFGIGGVADEIWSHWRKHKINETLSSTLLDLVLIQGDDSALQRGGFRDLEAAPFRSQKVFDGSESARLAGKYVPVMQKPRLDPVEVQNAKYREGRGSRREMRKAREINGDD